MFDIFRFDNFGINNFEQFFIDCAFFKNRFDDLEEKTENSVQVSNKKLDLFFGGNTNA